MLAARITLPHFSVSSAIRLFIALPPDRSGAHFQGDNQMNSGALSFYDHTSFGCWVRRQSTVIRDAAAFGG
jgi:hypothetical protein